MRARGASATTRANSAKRLFLEGTSSRARSAAGAYFLTMNAPRSEQWASSGQGS